MSNYRLQIVELPTQPAKPRLFGSGFSSTKMLINLEIAEAQVLPLIATAVELLRTESRGEHE